MVAGLAETVASDRTASFAAGFCIYSHTFSTPYLTPWPTVQNAVEDPNTNNEMVTKLFSRVRHNRIAEVTDLLEANIDIDVRDDAGNTPLMIAFQVLSFLPLPRLPALPYTARVLFASHPVDLTLVTWLAERSQEDGQAPHAPQRCA